MHFVWLTIKQQPKTITFTIHSQMKKEYIHIGQIASFRDIVFVKETDTMNKDERAFYDFLCVLQKHSCIVVEVDVSAKTITLDGSTIGLPLEMITSDISLETQFDYSILLNESMQYSFMLRFDCVEKRLTQTMRM